jgi:hypothetical protein
VNVGDHFSRVFQAEEDDIINAILHVGHSLPRDGQRLRISEPVLDDADIMRGKIPQGINIRANTSEVEPLTVNIANVAQLAAIDQLFDIPDGGIEQERMPHHDESVVFRGNSRDLIDLDHTGGQWLFHEDMLAGLQCLFRDRKVRGGGSGNNNALNFRVVEGGLA